MYTTSTNQIIKRIKLLEFFDYFDFLRWDAMSQDAKDLVAQLLVVPRAKVQCQGYLEASVVQ